MKYATHQYVKPIIGFYVETKPLLLHMFAIVVQCTQVVIDIGTGRSYTDLHVCDTLDRGT